MINYSDMENGKQRQAGAILSYLYTFIQIIVNLIYVPLLLGIIGQDEYGLYQFVGSIMSYLSSINSILGSGVGRFYSKYKAEKNFTMMESTLALARRLYFIAAVLSGLLIIFLIPFIFLLYKNSFTTFQLYECSFMLIVLAINLVVTFNNAVNVAAINAFERFTFLKLSQIFTLIAQPILILFIGKYFPHALTISLIMLLMNILCASLQRIYSQCVLKIRAVFHGWNKALLSGIGHFSLSVLLVTLADQIFWNTGKLLVGFFSGASLVAVYGIGSQICTTYMSAGISINGVFFQHVSELVWKNKDLNAVSMLFIKVGRISLSILLLILGGFAILGKDFIFIWAGEGFEASFWISLILMIPLTVDLIQNLGLTILQVLDKYYFRGYIYIGLSIFSIIISCLFYSKFGLMAIAVSSAICMVVGNGLIMNWYYSKKIGLDIMGFWKSIFQMSVPLLLLIFIFILIRIFINIQILNIIQFIVIAFSFIVAYVLVYIKFSANDEELDLLKKIFHLK